MRSSVSPSCFAGRVFIACIAMFFGVSCATTPSGQATSDPSQTDLCRKEKAERRELTANHVVVDDHGQLMPDDTHIGKIIDGLNEFKKGRTIKKRTILIFVHGGLTPEDEAIKLANDITPEMNKEGYFPLFLIWRTGPLETYVEQSACVRDGLRSEEAKPDTLLYWFADIGQGFVRAPLIYLKQVQRVIDRHRALPENGWKLQDERDHYRGGAVSADNNLIYTKEVDNHHVDLADEIWYYLTFPFRTVTSPITDGLGKTAWENMVRRARTTIHQTAEFDHDKHMGSSYGGGGFSKVFRAVGEWLRENDKKNEIRVTLIGHSMGAIVLNELIRTYDQFEYDDIVYMGAAASIRDMIRVVVPYLQRHPSARFYNLMLHPLNEAWELTWRGFVPSGSLLEWVDEMYEPPQTMLDRTLGKWRNLHLAKDLVDLDSQEHMVFKVFDGKGGKPRKHGDFNDGETCFWNPGFWVDEHFDWKAWNTPRRQDLEKSRNPENRDRRVRGPESTLQDWDPEDGSISLAKCKDNIQEMKEIKKAKKSRDGVSQTRGESEDVVAVPRP